MKKNSFLFLLAVLVPAIQAQNTGEARFVEPFEFPSLLSGNFGELRTNHFHGGIDFKTQGESGKKTLAVADGYISRIYVTHGSGYMLHIRHDNGYTSIYRHLSDFVPPVAERVRQYQYENETYEVMIEPEPDEYRVRAGEQVAWSGNTGYSFGPHLHLDLFETDTGDFVDPLPFFMDKIRDTTSPRADGIMLLPYQGRGVVNGKPVNHTFKPGAPGILTAWGEIGVAVKAFDYMDGTNNKYGVRSVTLYLDDEEIFNSTVDRFSTYENRMIYSWTTSNNYMKAFKEPGNSLRMLRPVNGNRGIVTIDQEREYRFRYLLEDLYGNRATYAFTVKGVAQEIPAESRKGKYFFAWNRTNYLQQPGMQLVVPAGLLYDDLLLRPQTDSSWIGPSYLYRISEEPVHLHGYADLTIAIRRDSLEDKSNYYVARIGRNGKSTAVEGEYKEGVMHIRIRELGTYTVAVDSVPPEVVPVNQAAWGKTGRVMFRIKDNESGIRSYKGRIDGAYALFGLEIMTNRIICTLDPRHVRKGGRHVVEVTVTDRCGNETVVTETFVW